MKKSFWGYNVKEVDENLQYLESVNEALSKKIAKLTRELDELNERADMEDFAAFGSDTASDSEKQKLMETINELTQKNETLKEQNSSLETQLEKLEVEAAELRQETQIGNNGFADIRGARTSVHDKLHEYVQTLMPEMQDKISLMDMAQKKVIELCTGARDSFLDAADAILEQYDSFIGRVQENDEVNEEYMEATEALRRELEEIIDTYLPPEPEVEYVQESEMLAGKSIDSHRVLQDIINRSPRHETAPAPAKKEKKQEPSIVRVADNVKDFPSAEQKQESPKIVPATRKETAEPKQEAPVMVPTARKETAEPKKESSKIIPAARKETVHESKDNYSDSLFETTDINDMMFG